MFGGLSAGLGNFPKTVFVSLKGEFFVPLKKDATNASLCGGVSAVRYTGSAFLGNGTANHRRISQYYFIIRTGQSLVFKSISFPSS